MFLDKINTRVNPTYLDGKTLKWQIEVQGCYGLWFPIGIPIGILIGRGRDALFDTKEEAEEARQRLDKYYTEQSEKWLNKTKQIKI